MPHLQQCDRLSDRTAAPNPRNEAKANTIQAIMSVADLLQREATFVPALPIPGTAIDEAIVKARDAFPKPEEVEKKLKAPGPSAQLIEGVLGK